jgi:hypothetical protein
MRNISSNAATHATHATSDTPDPTAHITKGAMH